MPVKKSEKTPGFVHDEKRGFLVPDRMTAINRNAGIMNAVHPLKAFQDGEYQSSSLVTTRTGTRVEKDDATGIPLMPVYGSGFDDILARSIVGGYVKGVGYAPVIDPVLSSVITRIIHKIGAWKPMVTGKMLQRRRVMETINEANGSEIGYSEFTRQIAAALFIDNRGATFAKLPIYSVPFDMWEEFGINAVPVDGREEEIKIDNENSIPMYYYLPALTSTSSMRRNRRLETVDSLECIPTGNPQWPFWIRKAVGGQYRTQYTYTLVNGTIGNNVLVNALPRQSSYYGMGQSAVWRYMSVMVKDIIVQDTFFEEMIAQPPMGIVWGSGLDYDSQLRDAMIAHGDEMKDGGIGYYPGVLIAGSENEQSKVVFMKYRERPLNFTDKEWAEAKENLIAQCVWVGINEVAHRPGRGSATQSLLGADGQSEGLFAFMRQALESIFNWLDPEVTVQAVWSSDRTKRNQFEILDTLMGAVEKAQKSSENQAFTPDEIKAIFEQRGNVDVPTGASADMDTNVFSEINAGKASYRVIRSSHAPNGEIEPGTIVILRNRDYGIVIEDTGNYAWVRSRFGNKEILYPKTKLRIAP